MFLLYCARASTCLPAGPALGPDFAGTLQQSLGVCWQRHRTRAPIAWWALRHRGTAAAASVTNRRRYYSAIGATAALQLVAAAQYNNVSWDARWLWHEMVFDSSIWELLLACCW